MQTFLFGVGILVLSVILTGVCFVFGKQRNKRKQNMNDEAPGDTHIYNYIQDGELRRLEEGENPAVDTAR